MCDVGSRFSFIIDVSMWNLIIGRWPFDSWLRLAQLCPIRFYFRLAFSNSDWEIASYGIDFIGWK